ncbi:MAG: DNA translocase FtsK [Solirubrobacterales bacterium]
MATKTNKKRPATAKTRAATKATVKNGARSSARKPAPRKRPAPVSQALTRQQRLDAVGLGLLAAAVFFAFVFYFGWQGGRLGDGVESLLTSLLGRGAYLAPLALAVGGIVSILRPALPPLAFRWPGFAVFGAGVLLAFSAGTLGLGAEDPTNHVVFNSAYYEGHGGLSGEGMFWVVSKLLGIAGAHVVAVALIVIGAVQLPGVPLVAMASAFRSAIETLRGRNANPLAETRAGRATRRPIPRVEELIPPEPEGVEPVVRATHVEAPAMNDAIPVREEPKPEPAPVSFDDEAVELIAPDVEHEPVGVLPESDPPPRAGGSINDPTVTASDHHIAYKLPTALFLERSKESVKDKGSDAIALEKTSKQLTEALGHFGVESTLVGTVAGPHVTRFELKLAPGTKMSKVSQLKDDLAYALASTDIRILAPIPGKQAVGVEVPNIRRRIVRLGDVYQPLPRDWSPVSVWLGKDIAGKAIGTDIAKMPHMLVAGTTGAGKSGCINTLLCSILLNSTPNEVKLVLVDPKQVELNLYEGIPHLLTPVVTSPRMAANVLSNLIREMEQRYTLMSGYRVRNIGELNEKRKKEGEPTLPYMLCVIDELADLMMVAPGEVEDSIIRLAQKSRAVGIHLLLATQRPSADIITGMIKANVPSRIAFAVSSQTDSRVILDQNGAESLLGQGDMLFSPIGSSRLQRIQGAYVTEEEIIELTDFWREQGEPEFHTELLEATEEEAKDDRDGMDPDQDDLLPDAISTVVQMGTASTSMLQRRLRVGYTRAGRLIDMMERRAVISGYEGSKARQVLITEADLPRILEMLKSGTPPEPVQEELTAAVAEETLEHSAINVSDDD